MGAAQCRARGGGPARVAFATINDVHRGPHGVFAPGGRAGVGRRKVPVRRGRLSAERPVSRIQEIRRSRTARRRPSCEMARRERSEPRGRSAVTASLTVELVRPARTFRVAPWAAGRCSSTRSSIASRAAEPAGIRSEEDRGGRTSSSSAIRIWTTSSARTRSPATRGAPGPSARTRRCTWMEANGVPAEQRWALSGGETVRLRSGRDRAGPCRDCTPACGRRTTRTPALRAMALWTMALPGAAGGRTPGTRGDAPLCHEPRGLRDTSRRTVRAGRRTTEAS